jgi:hypothetical protein
MFGERPDNIRTAVGCNNTSAVVRNNRINNRLKHSPDTWAIDLLRLISVRSDVKHTQAPIIINKMNTNTDNGPAANSISVVDSGVHAARNGVVNNKLCKLRRTLCAQVEHKFASGHATQHRRRWIKSQQ